MALLEDVILDFNSLQDENADKVATYLAEVLSMKRNAKTKKDVPTTRRDRLVAKMTKRFQDFHTKVGVLKFEQLFMLFFTH